MKHVRITIKEQEEVFKKAWIEAEYSPCLKKKVGAVLYHPIHKGIMARGFGGAEEPCMECVRKTREWSQDGCWSIHSELRAIFDFFRGGREFRKDLSKYIMFTTHGPCDQCLKYMNLFKIPAVIYDVDYHNDYSKWEGKIQVLKKGEAYDFKL